MDKEIENEKERLDSLFKKIGEVEDIELKAHWAKYLCVLLSGFIENAMKITLNKYSRSKSHNNIADFVGSRLRRVTNLNEERIKQLLNSFSRDWKDIFENNISEEEKSAFDSVFANRHQIAHGRNIGLSYVQVKGYYSHIVNALRDVHQIVNQENI
jgi:hypothetical protein